MAQAKDTNIETTRLLNLCECVNLSLDLSADNIERLDMITAAEVCLPYNHSAPGVTITAQSAIAYPELCSGCSVWCMRSLDR